MRHALRGARALTLAVAALSLLGCERQGTVRVGSRVSGNRLVTATCRAKMLGEDSPPMRLPGE